MSEIKITPYGPQWEKAHQVFSRKHYNNRRRRVLPHYLYWKSRGERGEALPSFILALVGDEVVGQLGRLAPEKILWSAARAQYFVPISQISRQCRSPLDAPKKCTPKHGALPI